MPKKICREASCQFIAGPSGYCEKHEGPALARQRKIRAFREQHAPSKAYSWMYKTKEWKRIRAAHLKEEPLCRHCLEAGRYEPATVVDHITPHRGHWTSFITGPFQSLCESCHNVKTREEQRTR